MRRICLANLPAFERTLQMRIDKLSKEILEKISEKFELHQEVSFYNTKKVVDAFRAHRVSEYYFSGSSGYGYADQGRDSLGDIYAEIFGVEKALVRSQFVSGTHALSTALFGVLRPGDELLAVTGAPYDTLQTVIGATRKQAGSLTEHGILYKEVALKDGVPDLAAIKQAMNSKTKIVHIQRSRGYADRKTLSVEEIGAICAIVKRYRKNCICFVDNCYGEFTEKTEPTQVGADLIAGSLIKNPGGGLAPSGAYIAGRSELVDMAARHLTAPGLGDQMGATLGIIHRLMYQGLFLAPHVTLQAIKSAIYAAGLFEKLGYKVSPCVNDFRSDIIQCIALDTPETLQAFCQAIQRNSPVDGHVMPIPGQMPGYNDPVIMAAGTFVQGASIELSADGPMREPYNVYLQGGLTFEHSVLALSSAARDIIG